MRSLLFCTAVVLVSGNYLAKADLVTFYSDPGSWNAAVTGVSTINFEDIASPTGFAGSPSGSGALDPFGNGYADVTPSFALGNAIFGLGPDSSDGNLFVIGDAYYGFGVATISAQGSATDTNNDLLVTLPVSATAVAFDLWVDPGILTITLSDGSTEVLNPTDLTPSDLFVAVTDAAGITSVDITEPWSLDTESVNMSDFLIATANETPVVAPEPGSLALFGAGFAGIVAAMRLRRCS
jgi:hypothetical protein